MNSFVYRFYMRDEMILKTVIFASAFGLVIDSFKTAKEKEIYKFSFFILLAVFLIYVPYFLDLFQELRFLLGCFSLTNQNILLNID